MSLRVAVVPPVPALLQEYAGRTDPVAELRAACMKAVGWLVDDAPARVVVLCDPPSAVDVARGIATSLGERVARELLRSASYDGQIEFEGDAPTHLLVLANGSARRGDKAPGHLDERALGFDDTVRAAVASGDRRLLRAIDAALGEELLAAGIAALHRASEHVDEPCAVDLLHDADPFGVQYWVATWSCG